MKRGWKIKLPIYLLVEEGAGKLPIYLLVEEGPIYLLVEEGLENKIFRPGFLYFSTFFDFFNIFFNPRFDWVENNV